MRVRQSGSFDERPAEHRQQHVRITERAIVITGTPIREPMMATRVTINCPYTPNLSREYMLLVDPAGTIALRRGRGNRRRGDAA